MKKVIMNILLLLVIGISNGVDQIEVEEKLTSLRTQTEENSNAENIDSEEVENYLNEMFLTIARQPERVGEYAEVLTKESIETIEQVQWYYEKQAEIYNTVATSVWGREEDWYYGDTIVGLSENKESEIYSKVKTDLQKEYMEKYNSDEGVVWHIFWKYELDSEIVSVQLTTIDGTANNKKEMKCDAAPFLSMSEKVGLEVTEDNWEIKRNLSIEECKDYANSIFLTIAKNSDNIERYESVLTEASIQLLNRVTWYKEYSTEQYTSVDSYIYQEDNYYYGETMVGLDEKPESYSCDGEVVWKITWCYDVERGVIRVNMSEEWMAEGYYQYY